jgi:hypothetical protein
MDLSQVLLFKELRLSVPLFDKEGIGEILLT